MSNPQYRKITDARGYITGWEKIPETPVTLAGTGTTAKKKKG